MSTTTISALTAAATIDATADYLPIDQASSSTTKKISRNTLLGITGSPVGTSDSQVLTNKTVGNTNTVTLKDTLFTLQDDGDATKQAQFQLSGITAGQTRTLTIPDASLTLVGAATTQTLTNKTLTSPAITGGTIDNSTITVDSISGHTVATTVTVGSVQLANGVINTANAVTSTSIAAGAVQPQALVSGTGTGWGWSAWTPSWSGLTVGNGTTTATYVQIGKTVFYRLFFMMGSTSVMGTNATYTLPVTSVNYGPVNHPIANAIILDAGTKYYTGFSWWVSTTTAGLVMHTADATFTYVSNPSATTPMTWTTSDQIWITGFYEAA